MAKCNVPDCKSEAGEMGICMGHLAEYRKGNADLKKYLNPPSGKSDSWRSENPKLGTCRVPGCGNPAYCRGICQKHYMARKAQNETGKEARKYALPPKTGGSVKPKPHAAAPPAADANSSLLILLMILKGAAAERFSLLRDDGRDEVTIIDKDNKVAFRAIGVSSVKVTQSRLE